MSQSDKLNVKYAVKVFTDASGDSESAEVYFVNGQIRKPLKKTVKMSGSQLKTLLLFMPGKGLVVTLAFRNFTAQI